MGEESEEEMKDVIEEVEDERGQSPLVKKCLGSPSRGRTEDGTREDICPGKPESWDPEEDWRRLRLHRLMVRYSVLEVSSFLGSVCEWSSSSIKFLVWLGTSTILSSIWSGVSDGFEEGVVGVLLDDSFCTGLGVLLHGEREDNEGLSGRVLGTSIWSSGRALPVSLTWRPLEEEFPVEPALSVGMTAAWGMEGPGNGDAEVLVDETWATGVVGLLWDVLPGLEVSELEPRFMSEDPVSSSSSTFKLSPMETERDILAIELVVGLM